MSDQTPPRDIAAEQSLLGGVMLMQPILTDVIQTGITGGDFYRPQHQSVWDAITALASRGDPYDLVSVVDELSRRGLLSRLDGGAVYLHELTAGVPTGANAAYYARIVIGKAAQRRLIETGTRIVQLGYEPDGATPEDLITAAQGHVMALNTPGGDQTWAHISQVMDDVMDAADPAAEHSDGIEWGWVDVDEVLRPLTPGQFAVVMAWSGVGKTIFVGNVAYSAAVLQGAPTLVHALEMSNREMGTRMAAAACGIDLERFARRSLTPKDWEDLARVRKYIDDAPLVFDDCESLNLAKLAASIRRHKPRLVIVDQIPIMVPNDPRAPREQQVANLAYGLKRLARSEGVSVLACAQLNADGLKRVEKKPGIHDSRESKAIIHASDVGLLLNDPTFGELEHVRKGEIDLIIGKQRAGKKDITIPLANQAHYGRFRDLAR